MRNLPNNLSRREFLHELSKLSDYLRHRLEVSCKDFPVDKNASFKRVNRVKKDFSFFRRTYFPHYIHPKAGDSLLHLYLDKMLPKIANRKKGTRLALAAPRGEAKSTFIGLFFLLWCLFTNRKRFFVLIADSKEQAAALLAAVKAELEENPRLAMDFASHIGEGEVWTTDTIITRSHAKIIALGAGTKMRGLRHGPTRPDLVILDDLENDENVRSLEQRQKLADWLHKTVLHLGPPDGSMDTIYIGTVLHYDSVLARTLANPSWETKKFTSIIAMPHNMRLWDTWENIFFNQGKDAASGFYLTNQEKMDEGAVVSWPSMRPLHTLMTLRAENISAFDAEMQNSPLSEDTAPFAKSIHYWDSFDETWLLFGAVDPSLGSKSFGSDPSAILIGGFDRQKMTLHVIEADIRKRHPDDIITDVISLHKKYNCLIWAVEAIQFQEFFAHILEQKAVSSGVALPIKPIKPHTDKLLRIASLQPYLANKRILLRPEQKTLIDQLKHFPKSAHDDGPDALHMLWEIALATASTGIANDIVTVPKNKAWHY